MILEKGKTYLNPLDYADVTLSDSHFKTQFDEMVEYYLAIPNDDILYGFRERAGLPHPGNPLGGWYSNEASTEMYYYDEKFNVFGQWLTSFARIYKITKDERVLEKAKILLTEWGKTIEDDGYFYYSNNCNAFHYVYEKVLGGLVDLYVYAGLEEAKKYMAVITDWAEKNLERTRIPANADGVWETVGGNPESGYTDNEWYTLSENLYRAYLATEDEKYKDFAEVWHYDYYWDALRNGELDKMTRLHGYSHINNVGGAALAYRVTGDEKYLESMVKGYEIFKKHQFMASGGFAFGEEFANPHGSNYKAVEKVPQSFEVPCGSWAGFKLTRHLISLTKEAKYGEWAETLLYNAIGGALPMRDDNQRIGKTFYYADYRVGGGRKIYHADGYPCCSGTFPQALAEYYNLIYYKDDEGLYITQYIPSSIQTEVSGKTVEVSVAGEYPKTDYFTVAVNTDGAFKLSLRAPSWLKEGEGKISLNGEVLDVQIAAGEWIVLDREWCAGDALEVTFPMYLWTSGITTEHPERAALMYGPIMLVAEGRHYEVDEKYDDLLEMEQTKNNLSFTSKDGLVFRPYWEFGYREWYTCYLDYVKK